VQGFLDEPGRDPTYDLGIKGQAREPAGGCEKRKPLAQARFLDCNELPLDAPSGGQSVLQVCSSRAARDGQSLSQVASHGFRAIAHDRRGHRRSSQPWDGNDPDTYADDLAELIEALDLRDVGLTPQLATARFTPLGYRIDRG
jgi:hypothetical protein